MVAEAESISLDLRACWQRETGVAANRRTNSRDTQRQRRKSSWRQKKILSSGSNSVCWLDRVP